MNLSIYCGLQADSRIYLFVVFAVVFALIRFVAYSVLICLFVCLLVFLFVWFFACFAFSDIDVCVEGSHNCSPNTFWNKTKELHNCISKPRYIGNGRECKGNRDFAQN